MNEGPQPTRSWSSPMFFAALAGGMAWGIRGQYGHETGAMMAGLLVSATLVFLLVPGLPLLVAARAIALCTVAMGFGGSMTYGVTLGLSHNPEFIGNWASLSWGLLGCAIKGGVWIGFAAVFFGMGLGGRRYRAGEMLLVMLAMLGAYFIGVRLFNYPFNPEQGQLPFISFSDFDRWDPNTEVRPRREQWGGLWLALATLLVYVRTHRGDRLAGRLGLWGILGGAVGFPLGQSLQAYHSWNVASFRDGLWANLDPYMNWWNTMETTFGATMGAIVGLGLWLNRDLVRPTEDNAHRPLPFTAEGVLLAVHLALLLAVEFLAIRHIDALYDLGLIMGIIPMVAVMGGRLWPYLVTFPVILVPIAGKTLRGLSYQEEVITVPLGWLFYVILPGLASMVTLIWFARRDQSEPMGLLPAGVMLMVPAWTFFLLNYAFFRYPFPWVEWTGRTPSGIVFTFCVAALTALVAVKIQRAKRDV